MAVLIEGSTEWWEQVEQRCGDGTLDLLETVAAVRRKLGHEHGHSAFEERRTERRVRTLIFNRYGGDAWAQVNEVGIVRNAPKPPSDGSRAARRRRERQRAQSGYNYP